MHGGLSSVGLCASAISSHENWLAFRRAMRSKDFAGLDWLAIIERQFRGSPQKLQRGEQPMAVKSYTADGQAMSG
jgi:hypothetical protein